jgi:hypothetical protein
MTNLEKVLYSAHVHTTGGRDGGTSRTDDGRLQVALSMPGTSATGTNPEQLFAAGWSACVAVERDERQPFADATDEQHGLLAAYAVLAGHPG